MPSGSRSITTRSAGASSSTVSASPALRTERVGWPAARSQAGTWGSAAQTTSTPPWRRRTDPECSTARLSRAARSDQRPQAAGEQDLALARREHGAQSDRAGAVDLGDQVLGVRLHCLADARDAPGVALARGLVVVLVGEHERQDALADEV